MSEVERLTEEKPKMSESQVNELNALVFSPPSVVRAISDLRMYRLAAQKLIESRKSGECSEKDFDAFAITVANIEDHEY